MPIKREEYSSERSDGGSPSNLLSFLTVPTDSQSAVSGRNYGGAQTMSMNYTESQSAGQTGGSHANQEDTATREQMVVEEGNRREAVDPREAGKHDNEDEDLFERNKKAMMRRMAKALGEIDGDIQPTYGYTYPEMQIPIPTSPDANVSPVLPTEFEINGESLSQKRDKYMSAAGSERNEPSDPRRNGQGLILPESRGRSPALSAHRFRPMEMHIKARSGNSTPRQGREESPFELPQRGRLPTRKYMPHEGASRENNQGSTRRLSRSPPADRILTKSGLVPTERTRRQILQLNACTADH